MQIDLNIFRTRLVIDLQHNSFGRRTKNILFSAKSDAHSKDKAFPQGEFLLAAIKYAAHCINFIPIKQKNTIHTKCALIFCDACSE